MPANKELQGWINQKIGDVSGLHQEMRIWDSSTHSYKRADWGYTYANGKAILIEGKEKTDGSINDAIKQLNLYETLLRQKNYTDILKIAVKQTKRSKIIKVYRNNIPLSNELKTIKEYEILIGAKKAIDISKEMFQYTTKINEILNDEFKIVDLGDRMLFTGCILVASKFGNGEFRNYAGIEGFKTLVSQKIASLFTKEEIRQSKVNELLREFQSVSINLTPSNDLIESICDMCNEINALMKNNPLSDIDIMNIFFTEFNRYRIKPKEGQVFTPDHIADLMANLLNIESKDKILDPTCGSGSLLLKASKYNGKNFENIFGNDSLMNVLRLSYINMLLHNDGITNLNKLDAREMSFANWIKSKHINKVIANPPYEKTFAIDILNNILNNVEDNCRIVWLMPNNKMEKIKKSKKLLVNNTLTDIIFLGDIFPKIGCGDVSLFLFTKGTPQDNKKIKCWHINDEFKTVKNQGYQDVNGSWPKILQSFLEKFEKNEFDKEIDPNETLCYPKEFKVEKVTKENFELTLMQYMLFKQGFISTQNTVQSTLKLVLNCMNNNKLKCLKLANFNTRNWKKFVVSDIFTNNRGKKYSKIPNDGGVPFVSSTSINNGIAKFCDLQPNQENCITVSTNGACFDCFYHKYKFCASTDVEVLYLKDKVINEQIGLFLCAILQTNKGKYDYSNKPKNGKVWKTIIKLPVDSKGQPDWKYMENYIKSAF